VHWYDLEKSSSGTVAAITQATESLGVRALHLPSLDALTERATQRHPERVVLSIFGGKRSRDRMALVPGICESFDVRFIAPNVYRRVICQDKEISKRSPVTWLVASAMPRWRLPMRRTVRWLFLEPIASNARQRHGLDRDCRIDRGSVGATLSRRTPPSEWRRP